MKIVIGLVLMIILAGCGNTNNDVPASKKPTITTTITTTNIITTTTVPSVRLPYDNCTEARNNNDAPLYEGDPGYSPKLDRNHDGIACN
jgi:hypothetical protein